MERILDAPVSGCLNFFPFASFANNAYVMGEAALKEAVFILPAAIAVYFSYTFSLPGGQIFAALEIF